MVQLGDDWTSKEEILNFKFQNTVVKMCKKYTKILLFVLVLFFLLVAAFFISVDTASKNNDHSSSPGIGSIESNVGHVPERADKFPVENEGIKTVSYYYKNGKSGEKGTVFSELLSYGKRNNIEVKYNNDYSFGVFVESIGGVENGDEGRYWQYYVNGILGDVAADKKSLKEGDRVEWKFEKVPF
jgi:hypothetical protein